MDKHVTVIEVLLLKNTETSIVIPRKYIGKKF